MYAMLNNVTGANVMICNSVTHKLILQLDGPATVAQAVTALGESGYIVVSDWVGEFLPSAQIELDVDATDAQKMVGRTVLRVEDELEDNPIYGVVYGTLKVGTHASWFDEEMIDRFGMRDYGLEFQDHVVLVRWKDQTTSAELIDDLISE